ncbi:MAG: cupin domain-containing protein [Planctomycetota bacterium]
MSPSIEPINLEEKLASFDEAWSPKIIAALNGQHVRLAKLRGEFVWHHHDDEDELFLVIQGQLTMELRDKTLELGPGEMVVIPRGVEHRPVAKDEAQVLLFEPAATVNTGADRNERTVDELEWI